MSQKGGLCSRMGQGKRLFKGVDALGCLCWKQRLAREQAVSDRRRSFYFASRSLRTRPLT